MPPELRPRHLAAMARFQASGDRSFPWQAVRLPGMRKDGKAIELEISFGEFRDNGSRRFVGIIRDVTEHVLAERKMREGEARYRDLFENSPLGHHSLGGVYFTRADGSVFDCNDAFAQVLGFASREELLGSSPSDFYVHATDRDALLARLQTERFVTGIESTFRTRDGASKWVLQNLAWVSRPGEEPRIEASVVDITA